MCLPTYNVAISTLRLLRSHCLHGSWNRSIHILQWSFIVIAENCLPAPPSASREGEDVRRLDGAGEMHLKHPTFDSPRYTSTLLSYVTRRRRPLLSLLSSFHPRSRLTSVGELLTSKSFDRCWRRPQGRKLRRRDEPFNSDAKDHEVAGRQLR